jgi:predicted TIM-barrel fold metal-dependent hydrolase
MIIDCHSHIWPSLNQLGQAQGFSCLGLPDSLPAKPEQHLESSGPAEAVLVLGFVSDMLKAEIPNPFIRDYVAAYPERMIGLAGIDPTRSGGVQELQRLHKDDNFAGAVLSPACQGFHPCDTRAMRLYELAEQSALPIYFLYGEVLPQTAALECANPTVLDEVGRSFPNLKIVISHLGFPWIEQTLALLSKHPHIYADVAGLTEKPWQAYRTLTLAYEYGVIEKLLFASDFPCSTVKAAAEAMYNLNKITLDSVLPAVPREQLRSIVERNSLELLGLSLPSEQPVPTETAPKES